MWFRLFFIFSGKLFCMLSYVLGFKVGVEYNVDFIEYFEWDFFYR